METNSFNPMPYVIVLNEAHELTDLMRERLRFLKKRYGFSRAVVTRFAKAGIDLTDTGDDRNPYPRDGKTKGGEPA